MTTLVNAQTSFIGGALDPFVWANTSAPIYTSGAKTLTNVDIDVNGAARKRPGSLFITQTKEQGTAGLLTFQPEIDKGYVLEFGNLYIRFFLNGAQVMDGPDPLEITTTYSSSDLYKIQYDTFNTNLYFACEGYPAKMLILNDDASWTFRDFAPSIDPTLEIGFSPNTTLTPGATSGNGVTFTAGSSVFQASYVGRKLVNLSGAGVAVIVTQSGTTCTADVLTAFPSTSAIASGDWKLDRSPQTTITPSGKEQGAKITLTLAVAGWVSTDVGSYVSLNGGLCKITAYTSTTVVDAIVMKKLNSAGTTRVWALEQLEWTSDRGYPEAVCVYEQRLIWARDLTLFGSAIGLYDDFATLKTDASAIVFNIAQNQTNKILWMKNNKSLIIGTLRGIITVGQEGGMITVSSPAKIINQSDQGSSKHRPVQVDDKIAFIGKDKKRIYLINPSATSEQRYDIIDLMQFASHYTKNTTIESISYSSVPYGKIFAVLADGTMLRGTLVATSTSFSASWSQYTTDGSYKQVGVLTSETTSDNVYTFTQRDSLGDILLAPSGAALLSPGGYVLVSAASSDQGVEVFNTVDIRRPEAIHVDCAVVRNNKKEIASITQATPCQVYVTAHGYSTGNSVILTTEVNGLETNPTSYVITVVDANSFTLDSSTSSSTVPSDWCRKKTNTLAGLDHLDGETVSVLADGIVISDKTVASGSITLHASTLYGIAVAGLPYTYEIETLPTELGKGTSKLGSFVGQPCRLARPVLYLMDADIPTMENDTPVSLTTADAELYGPTLETTPIHYSPRGFNSNFTVSITHSRPLPCAILGIFGKTEGNQR